MIEPFLPGLAKALEYAGGTHTIEDLLDQIKRGDAQLWTSENACIVTEVQDFPRKRVLHFWLAAGGLHPVIALSRDVLDWSKSIGCASATLTGRRGWEKVLASEGWSPMLYTMGREV